MRKLVWNYFIALFNLVLVCKFRLEHINSIPAQPTEADTVVGEGRERQDRGAAVRGGGRRLASQAALSLEFFPSSVVTSQGGGCLWVLAAPLPFLHSVFSTFYFFSPLPQYFFFFCLTYVCIKLCSQSMKSGISCLTTHQILASQKCSSSHLSLDAPFAYILLLSCYRLVWITENCLVNFTWIIYITFTEKKNKDMKKRESVQCGLVREKQIKWSSSCVQRVFGWPWPLNGLGTNAHCGKRRKSDDLSRFPSGFVIHERPEVWFVGTCLVSSLQT